MLTRFAWPTIIAALIGCTATEARHEVEAALEVPTSTASALPTPEPVERLRRRQEQYIKWAVPESDVIVLGRIEATEKIRRFWYAVGEVYEMDAGNLLVSEVLAGSPRGEAIGVTMPARTGLPDLGREAVWFLARQADGSWYVNAAFELDDWLTRDRVAKLISLEN